MSTRIFKRIGIAGFTFFLVKGLVWLALAAGAWAGLGGI
jgi:hypothetical protein